MPGLRPRPWARRWRRRSSRTAPSRSLGALVLIASVAACLLQAEIYLHIVLPAWRLAHALLTWMLVWARLILARLLAIGREPERVLQPSLPC